MEITKLLQEGKIFIYPTDTIYGLGCNALDVCAVERIKKIKGRDKDKPMSVIAPSLEWINENCVVPCLASSQFDFRDIIKPAHLPKIAKIKLNNSHPNNKFSNSYLKKYLPGPYTLILKKKNQNFLKHVASGDSLGVRIPNCDFTFKIQESGVPFITTSVNLSGEKPANNIGEISKEILNNVDFVIDEGELSGKPSILVIGDKEIER